MKKGFSLLELVIVVTIIGLVLAVVSIKFTSVSNTLRLKAVTKTIVSEIRLCQIRAQTEKQMISINFDFNSYTIGGKKTDLPNPIKITNPQTVAFSNSGQPIPGFFGTISISDGNNIAKIIISPVGRVRTE